MKEKIKTILLIGLVSVLLISHVSAVSIGIVPSRFTIGDAHRGEVYDQKLTIYNTANQSCNYGFEGTGEIGDWASFFALDSDTPINMTEVPGKSSKKVNVRFLIPSYVATGSYTGDICVRTIPGDATGAMVVPVLATQSRGRIMVTEKQTLTGIVTNITALDTEVNNTLRVKVEFQNTGNVIANPAINVSIATNESLVDCFVYDKIGVMPGANETIPVEWNTTGQISGNYSLNVSVSLDSNVLAAQNLTVRILPG
jgi:hypothetical protein